MSTLLKTSSEAFDSLSKAISLNTSSILDGIAKLKLDEVVPRSKEGEEDLDASKKKTSPETTKPETIINLEKTPSPEATKEKTPPAAKGKDTAAGPKTVKKPSPRKTTDPTKPGPSATNSDDNDSFSGEEEDEEEKARKAHIALTKELGRQAALQL